MPYPDCALRQARTSNGSPAAGFPPRSAVIPSAWYWRESDVRGSHKRSSRLRLSVRRAAHSRRAGSATGCDCVSVRCLQCCRSAGCRHCRDCRCRCRQSSARGPWQNGSRLITVSRIILLSLQKIDNMIRSLKYVALLALIAILVRQQKLPGNDRQLHSQKAEKSV